MIKVIVFDGGGTLVASLPKPERINNILMSQGYKLGLNKINDAFFLSRDIAKLLREKGLIKLDGDGYLVENEIRMMLLGFEGKIVTRLAKKICREMLAAGKTKPYPETVKVLNSLKKRRYRVGILTAGTVGGYRTKLRELSLLKYFDFIVGEDTTNAPKPDPRAYKYIISIAKCEPREILFVGNEFVNDYREPRRHKMNAVLVDRENRYGKNVTKIGTLLPLSNNTFLSRFK